MKALRMFGALLVLGAIGAGAASATDKATMQARLGKYATTDVWEGRYRGLCVCQDDGPYLGKAGVLVQQELFQDPFLTVLCITLGYASDGSLSGTGGQCANFAVLSK